MSVSTMRRTMVVLISVVDVKLAIAWRYSFINLEALRTLYMENWEPLHGMHCEYFVSGIQRRKGSAGSWARHSSSGHEYRSRFCTHHASTTD